jgi:hypothetical protein
MIQVLEIVSHATWAGAFALVALAGAFVFLVAIILDRL